MTEQYMCAAIDKWVKRLEEEDDDRIKLVEKYGMIARIGRWQWLEWAVASWYDV